MAEFKQMSLRECGKHDASTGARSKFTGWGIICHKRSNDNSKSQRRKRNRAGNKWQKAS